MPHATMKSPTVPIWLPRRLHDEMRDLARRAYPNETGGALIGFDAGNGLVVTALIGPGPQALHEPHAFTPDYEYQDEDIERIYVRSGRCHTYLGDWHSHPGGISALSTKDKRALRVIASHRPARAPAPVMGILANGDPWRLSIWRCFRRHLRAGRLFSRYEEMQILEVLTLR